MKMSRVRPFYVLMVVFNYFCVRYKSKWNIDLPLSQGEYRHTYLPSSFSQKQSWLHLPLLNEFCSRTTQITRSMEKYFLFKKGWWFTITIHFAWLACLNLHSFVALGKSIIQNWRKSWYFPGVARVLGSHVLHLWKLACVGTFNFEYCDSF